MSAPTEQLAAALARSQGTPVEVSSRTTPTEQTLANPDGSFTLSISSAPVRAMRAGAWVAVDPTLSVSADGRVRPYASAIDVSFSNGGRGPAVIVTAEGATVAWSWPTALPVPTISSDRVTYASVYPGVDLVLRATSSSFADVLVVHSAQAATSVAGKPITLAMAITGGTVSADGGGGFKVVNALGGVALRGDAPAEWDSRGATGTSGPAAQASVAGPSATVTEPGGGPVDRVVAPLGSDRFVGLSASVTGSSLVVTAASSLFSDPATVYPVYVDPSTSLKTGSWAMADQYFPTAKYWNWSDAGTPGGQGVGHYADTTQYPTVESRRLYFSFPTSTLSKKVITSASFTATEVWAWSCTAAAVNLYESPAVTSALTWNTRPAWGKLVSTKTVAHGYPGCTTSSTVSSSPTLVSFDAKAVAVDAAAKGWGTTWVGLGASETTNSWKRFKHDATLVVVYRSVPNVPTITNPTCGASPGPTHAPSVIFKAKNVVSPDKVAVKVTFDVARAGGTAIANLSTQPVTVTPTTEQQVGPITLVGGTYTMDAYTTDMSVKLLPLSSAKTPVCYFQVDASTPPSPQVYLPATGPSGAPVPATVVLPAGTTRYAWTINRAGAAPGTGSFVTGAGTLSLPVTFPTSGNETLYVWSMNGVGTVSTDPGSAGITISGTPALARWGLDDSLPGGAGPADEASACPANVPLRSGLLSGGVSSVGGRWIASDPSDLALQFAGTAADTLVSGAIAMPGPDDVSATAWVAPNGLAGTAFALGAPAGGTPLVSVSLTPDPADATVSRWTATLGGVSVQVPTIDVVAGDWYHVTAGYSRSDGLLTLSVLQVDGLLIFPDSVSAVIVAPVVVPAQLEATVGGVHVATGFDQGFVGTVDELLVYGGSLNAQQVTYLDTAARPYGTNDPCSQAPQG